ncbi:MAG: fatty acid cis/trans isomerase [Methylophaga sp.]|nr:fatty acid cis/trans isomerase [Methylophaga sp.]
MQQNRVVIPSPRKITIKKNCCLWRYLSFFILSSLISIFSNSILATEFSDASQQQVKKIINNRCVICHGCYDAPCQLKLTSYEGLVRGANSNPLYNPSRINDGELTRLFIDAHSAQQWRLLEFHSVITPDEASARESIVAKLLEQKKIFKQDDGKPLANHFPLDITRELSCPSNDEVSQFLNKNPQFGMPYGMAIIPEEEQDLLEQWIEVGAPNFDVQHNITTNVNKQMAEWELFLNRRTNEQKLVSRYIYEHLFLGHMTLKDQKKSYFFRMIRSVTAPGERAIEIPTAHPNGEPGVEFYYRLVPITSTLVDKTHFTYMLSPNKLERFKQLFFSEKWTVKHLPEYTERYASNPFLTFQDIPARARYQFLLDDAYYFITNFIKGPVCRGQVALNVINDYFFVNFLSPDYDLAIIDKTYLKNGLDYLALSKNNPEISDFASSWLDRLTEHQEYLEYRDNIYATNALTKEGFSLNAIWQDPKLENDKLTVFRHFDSATVVRGFVGNKPATSWVLDYPTLERIYYNLVVNYNVFGNVSHQVLTRLYMDYLRMESESLTLAFLPKKEREEQLKRWYDGILAQTKVFFLHSKLMFNIPTKVQFQSENYFKELIEQIRNRQKDSLTQQNSNLFKALNEKQAKSSSWIKLMPEVVYIVIYNQDKELQNVFTLLRNKAHSNVSFIFGEDLRRLPDEDTTTLLRGTVGSYPNFIFTLSNNSVDDFIEQLVKTKDENALMQLASQFGARRTSPAIWTVLDDLHHYRKDVLKLDGLLDMSRYRNL